MHAQYASTGFRSGRNGTAASPPSLKPMRLPWPACRLSKITTSSPSGSRSSRRALRLYGTPMTQRNPVKLGWQRDSVTVPMTLAIRMTPILSIADAEHHPAHRRVLVPDHLTSARTIVGDEHALSAAGAEMINGQQR